jgi:stress-induced morphogen
MSAITEDFVRSKCLAEDCKLATVSHLDLVVRGGGCDGGSKITMTVVSTAFEKMPLLKRHRLVNEVFAKELETGSIHALSVKAYTPAQYESKK